MSDLACLYDIADASLRSRSPSTSLHFSFDTSIPLHPNYLIRRTEWKVLERIGSSITSLESTRSPGGGSIKSAKKIEFTSSVRAVKRSFIVNPEPTFVIGYNFVPPLSPRLQVGPAVYASL